MDEGIRINKFLSEAGVCSRREADRQIEAGNVTIDGITATCGSKVLEQQEVCFKGVPVDKEEEMILIAVNKPVGIVCTAEKREKDNIIDFIQYPKRIYPVGRLDKDSHGLILMTNNGEIVNKIMRAGNQHEKEYVVRVNRPVTDAFIRNMANGVPLKELQVMTRKCKVEKTGEFTFRIILTQGYNRQIRRMCEYFGYHVADLERIRIMNIQLGNLETGKYRKVSVREWEQLQKLIANSSITPVAVPEKKKADKIDHKRSLEDNHGRGRKTDHKRHGSIKRTNTLPQ